LLSTTDRVFRELVPILILLAAGLLALQDRLRAWLLRRVAQSANRVCTTSGPCRRSLPPRSTAATSARAKRNRAGVLGLVLEDSLTRLNGLKQAIAFSVNITAAIFFLFSDQVVWPAAIVMAAGALIGGSLGGRLAGRPASRAAPHRRHHWPDHRRGVSGARPLTVCRIRSGPQRDSHSSATQLQCLALA